MLRLLALALLSSTAASQTLPDATPRQLDWRVATDAGFTLGTYPYGTVALAVERPRRGPIAFGLRATGASKLYDVSYADPTPGSPVLFDLNPDEWYAGEATAAVEAASGAMVLRAQAGVGVTGWWRRGEGTSFGPTATAAVGVDLYPIRQLGVGIQADAAARATLPYARLSVGLRVRV